jgi:hypothetical protein
MPGGAMKLNSTFCSTLLQAKGGNVNQAHEQKEQVLSALNVCRTMVVDTVGQELVESPKWPIIKSRLLKYFGDRGLEGELRRIFGLTSRRAEHE